jgi:hypothetical protein
MRSTGSRLGVGAACVAGMGASRLAQAAKVNNQMRAMKEDRIMCGKPL